MGKKQPQQRPRFRAGGAALSASPSEICPAPLCACRRKSKALNLRPPVVHPPAFPGLHLPLLEFFLKLLTHHGLQPPPTPCCHCRSLPPLQIPAQNGPEGSGLSRLQLRCHCTICVSLCSWPRPFPAAQVMGSTPGLPPSWGPTRESVSLRTPLGCPGNCTHRQGE